MSVQGNEDHERKFQGGASVPIKAGKEHHGLWKRMKVTAFSVMNGKH